MNDVTLPESTTRFGPGFSKVEYLSIINCKGDVRTLLKEIVGRSSSTLQNLFISSLISIPIGISSFCSSTFPQLRMIYFINIEMPQDFFLVDCTNLNVLKMNSVTLPESITRVGSAFSKIQDLSICNCSGDVNALLEEIVGRSRSSLETLCLASSSSSPINLSFLSEYYVFSLLRSITLKNMKLPQVFFQVLSSKLKVFNLDNVTLPDKLKQIGPRFSNVENLSVCDCSGDVNTLLKEIVSRSKSSLATLTLVGSVSNPIKVSFLTGLVFPTLRSISLKDIELQKEFFHAQFLNLKHLKLDFVKLPNRKAITQVGPGFSKLEELFVWYSSGYVTALLQDIVSRSCSTLQILNLVSSPISARFLFGHVFSQLRSISLWDIELPKEFFMIECPKLKYINLMDVKQVPEDLQDVSPCFSGIEKLKVSGCEYYISELFKRICTNVIN